MNRLAKLNGMGLPTGGRWLRLLQCNTYLILYKTYTHTYTPYTHYVYVYINAFVSYNNIYGVYTRGLMKTRWTGS